MSQNPNKDYEELLKTPPIPLKKRPVQVVSESVKTQKDLTKLEKKVENLEKMLYNLKSLVDKQLRTIRILKNNNNQERANGHNNRPQTSTR